MNFILYSIYAFPIIGIAFTLLSYVIKTINRKEGYEVTYSRTQFLQDYRTFKAICVEKTHLRFLLILYRIVNFLLIINLVELLVVFFTYKH